MSHHHSRTEERREDIPPYSRLFVVCDKDLRDDDLQRAFEKFGEIEDIYRPRDRNSGEPRGVAYVKFHKTSSSAAAIKELHTKTIPNSNKPIKVMLATNRNDKSDHIDEEKLNRLFIKVPKQATVGDLKSHFSEFGDVESVYIQKDKMTDESKGLAYVQFKSFYDTAVAYEKCDKKYKAVFATPKQDLKRSRDSFDHNNDSYHSQNFNNRRDNPHDYIARDLMKPREQFPSMSKGPGQDFNSVIAVCSPQVSQNCIERLFNVIPGMVQCQYSLDYLNNCCKAIVTYNDNRAAAHAVDRLNNFEFPSGELLTVKPNNILRKAASELTNIVNSFKNAVDTGSPDLAQLAEAIAQASSVIKAATVIQTETSSHMSESFDPNYCSVVLPAPQPMVNTDRVAKRCFIVCKPHPPPLNVLKDVFRRFGDLIDVSTIPGKTFGFVKYASNRAAQDAIKSLHGATVCGVKLKVLEADEAQAKDDDHRIDADRDHGESSDNNGDRKKIRLMTMKSDPSQ